MKFKTEDLTEIIYSKKGEKDEESGLTFINVQHVGERRWETDKLLTFMFEDKYYQADFSIGNTEYQDSTLFGSEEEIECEEVEPYQVTVTKYRAKT